VVALFGSPSAKPLPGISLGDHHIQQIPWPADADLDPETASSLFADRMRAWYLGQATAA
jgi:hypothetical protein